MILDLSSEMRCLQELSWAVDSLQVRVKGLKSLRKPGLGISGQRKCWHPEGGLG